MLKEVVNRVKNDIEGEKKIGIIVFLLLIESKHKRHY